MSVNLSEEEYEEIHSYLNKSGFPSKIKRLQILVEEVIFDDGTVWSIGSWYKVDPDNPKNLILIEDKGGDNTALSTSDECVKIAYEYSYCINQPNFKCSIFRRFGIRFENTIDAKSDGRSKIRAG